MDCKDHHSSRKLCAAEVSLIMPFLTWCVARYLREKVTALDGDEWDFMQRRIGTEKGRKASCSYWHPYFVAYHAMQHSLQGEDSTEADEGEGARLIPAGRRLRAWSLSPACSLATLTKWVVGKIIPLVNIFCTLAVDLNYLNAMYVCMWHLPPVGQGIFSCIFIVSQAVIRWQIIVDLRDWTTF